MAPPLEAVRGRFSFVRGWMCSCSTRHFVLLLMGPIRVLGEPSTRIAPGACGGCTRRVPFPEGNTAVEGAVEDPIPDTMYKYARAPV